MINKAMTVICTLLGCYVWTSKETSMAAWASILMFSILAYLAERNWSIVAVAQADDELDEIQQLAERARLSREDQVSQTRDLFDRVKSFKSEYYQLSPHIETGHQRITPQPKNRSVHFELNKNVEHLGKETRIDQLVARCRHNKQQYGGGGESINLLSDD